MRTRSQGKVIDEHNKVIVKAIRNIKKVSKLVSVIKVKPVNDFLEKVKEVKDKIFEEKSFYLINTQFQNIIVTSKVTSRYSGLYNFNNSYPIKTIDYENICKVISMLNDKTLLIKPISFYSTIITSVFKININP
jgi:hypothetical protein